LQITRILLKIFSSIKARIIKAGLAKALALKKVYSINKVFEFCPKLKEWLEEPSYIAWLGLG